MSPLLGRTDHAARTLPIATRDTVRAHTRVLVRDHKRPLVTVLLWVTQRWTVREGLLGLLSAVPPFLTLWWERRLEARGRLRGGWRLGPGGEAPTTVPERVVALLLARPLLAVAAGVLAVLALTALALAVGPPVQTS